MLARHSTPRVISSISHLEPARTDRKKGRSQFDVSLEANIETANRPKRRENPKPRQPPACGTIIDQIVSTFSQQANTLQTCACVRLPSLHSQWQQEADAKVHGTARSVHECCRESPERRISIYASTSLSLHSLFSVFIVSRLLPSTCNPPSFPLSWFPFHSLVFIGVSLSSVHWGLFEEDVPCSYGDVPHGA